MKTRHYCDKTDWPEGPWIEEPDAVQWNTDGYECLILRHAETGNLNGYVGVPQDHPFYDLPDSDQHIADDYCAAHGGLTYEGWLESPIDADYRADGVEPRQFYWFGFDTAHAFDYMPGMAALMIRLNDKAPEYMTPDQYKDLAYCRKQVEGMVLGLKRARAEDSPDGGVGASSGS